MTERNRFTKGTHERTPVSELKIGQFSGGINRYNDPSAIADTELVDCVNYDIDLDGSLKSRPPWNTFTGDVVNILFAQTQTENSQRVMGSYVFAGYRLVVWTRVTVATGTGGFTNMAVGYTWVDGPNAGQSTVVKTDTNLGNPFTDVVRYKDTLYFFRAQGGSNGSGTLTGITLSGSTWTDKTYPPASSAFIYKERVFLVGDKLNNLSRMYFSDVGNADSYPGANFFDIRPGDGESLNDGIVYQDQVFLFKNNSIWVFAFDTQPAQAVLQQLHDDLGVDNEWSLALYENQIYFLKWNQVYMIANYDFTRVSTKIPFEVDKSLPTVRAGLDYTWKWPNWLSLVSDRLVVRYYNRIYIYNLRLRSWSRWESNDPAVQYIGQIVKVEDVGRNDGRLPSDVFVAGSSLNIPPVKTAPTSFTLNSMMKMTNDYDATSREGVKDNNYSGTDYFVDITLTILTKIYDIGISHRFKRLMHWGCDIVTGREVTGTLFPYSLAYRVTWEQLHQYTWAQLQTWGYPLFAQPTTTQTAPVDFGIYRRFIRFPKGLRFRLLQFKVQLETQGNTTDGPARLYSLTAFVVKKQLVPKGVN